MQNNNPSLITWFNENRDMAIEVLRIYLGVGLMIKGVQFMFDDERAQEYLAMVSLPFFDVLTLHIAAMIHVSCGLLLAIGLVTRAAALLQVPIMLGAVFFVHWQQGLFSREQNLEFVILVLFLLLVFVVYGSGRLSIDHLIETRGQRE